MAFAAAVVAARDAVVADREALNAVPALDAVVQTPVMAAIENFIQPHQGKEPEYEPLLFERYLVDASAACDRALTLRREIQSLENDAVSFAREYMRFSKLADVQKALELRPELENVARTTKVAFQSASNILQVAGPDAINLLARGLGAQSLGISQSAELNESAESSRRANIELKWATLASINSAEIQQHSIVGGALNFKERKDRLLLLLELDAVEAYKKCIAVREGLKVIFGVDRALPQISETNILDRLVVWIRSIFDLIEIRSEQEVTFTLQIPLMQPFRNFVNDGATALRLENAPQDAAAFNAIIGAAPQSGMLSFRTNRFLDESVGFLRSGSPGPQPLVKDMRVTGVSVAIGNNLAGEPPSRSARWIAVVFPPERPRALAGSKTTLRPPAILGNVRPIMPDIDPDLYTGDEVRNAPPYGEWRVKLMPQVSHSSIQVANRLDSVQDVKLVLQIKGTPNVSPGSW
jgi:hypothetical protein